ncbi:MAG: hypothetical protein LBI87_15105 [Candidatus Accumulibacter sp.]|nr:hypothetical protein [Accumulibacter sp.]
MNAGAISAASRAIRREPKEARTPPSARLTVAVALSLLVHLLLLGGFTISPDFAGKVKAGKAPGHALAASLATAPEKARLTADPEKSADTKRISAPPREPARRETTNVPRHAALMTPASERHGPEMPLGKTLERMSERGSEEVPEREAERAPEQILEQAGAPANPREAANESGETFFPRSRLTVAPVMLTEPALDDASPMPGGWRGRAVLLLFIDREGQVVDVQGNVSPDGDDDTRVLEQLIAAFKAVRFSPAQIGGLPVNSQIQLEIDAIDEQPGSSQTSGRPF